MKMNRSRLNLNIAKLVGVVVILNTIEIAIIIAMILYNYLAHGSFFTKANNGSISLFLYIVIFIVVLNSVITIKSVANSYHKRLGNEDSINATMEQLEKLNITLRAQRHDFMNHLQVVYSLMEMGEYDEATEYLDKVYNDIQKVNKFLKTSNAAINALLQAKALYAEKRDIAFEMEIQTQLAEMSIPSWELCRVLGNIIDNGIYALQESTSKGRIEITVSEDFKSYIFLIVNNGPEIPKNIYDKVFEVGFTTKADKGDGMGLAISKEIVLAAGGDIRLVSDKQTTSFEILIPKKS